MPLQTGFRLDYSQHTGFAAVLVFSLFPWNRRLGAVLAIVLIGYVALMLYQEYHTMAEMLTTVLVIVPATLAIPLLGRTAERRRQLATVRKD